MLKRGILWLRSNLLRSRYEREMRAEMSDHLERSTALLMQRGLTEEEARRQAQREFGDVAYHHTYARDARGTIWLDDLKADVRFALRHFARKPGTTVMMFVVLAFGMSVSTLLFSWVHGMSVLPPSGVTLTTDLVRIRGSQNEEDSRRFGEDEFAAYRNLTSHFAGVAGWADRDGVLQVPDDPERRGHQADLMFVTENFFRVVGVHPMLGAGLPTTGLDDPAASAVAVIDHEAWETLYGARPDIIGSTVMINNVVMTIAGVAPERFNGLAGNQGVQVFLPMSARKLLFTIAEGEYKAIARLRPGVTREAATAAVGTIAAGIDTTTNKIRNPGAAVVPLLAGNLSPEFDGDIRIISLMLACLGILVLLVTCTNVSALLTGLASARRQEIAVRLSLGAARKRVIRQLLTESAVLAVIAGAAALGLVALILKTAAAMLRDLPLDLQIEWPTTAFTFAVALAVGVLFGLSPALHATRLALASVLRDSSGGIASSRARLQRGLVVAQVAFTQPLIVLMATMLVMLTGTMKPMSDSDSAERVISLRVQTPVSIAWDYTEETATAQRDLMWRLRDQIRATPGVENAVIQWPTPYYPGVYHAHAEDRTGGAADATANLALQRAEGGHFATLGIPVISGRTFEAGDVTEDEPLAEMPVVIGTDLAAHIWGEADAVGRRLRMTRESADDATASGIPDELRTLVVVGVVEDPGARGRLASEPYLIYMPHHPSNPSETLLIRTPGNAAPLLPAIRDIARNAAGSAIIEAQTLAGIEAEDNADRRRISGAFSAAGVIALLLSAIGLYAVIAFSVSQRTQEIAVRLAVGARGSQIAYAFVRDGVRLSAFGLILGLPAGLFAMRQIVMMLHVGEPMPVVPTIAIASTGIFLVAAASAWGPARRAATVDPATALRRG